MACLLASSFALAQATPTASPGLPHLDRVMLTDPPKAVAAFELIDQNGATFNSSTLHGRPALVFFGYAHCPDVCRRRSPS